MSSKMPSNSGPTVITEDDIVELPEYDPREKGGPNSTDYNFPEDWGLWTDEMRSDWFTRHRVARQAARQDTAVGRRLQKQQEAEKRVSADEFKHDDDEIF